MNQYNQEIKTDLEKVLAERILLALDNKQIKLEEMKEMANYVLDKVENIKDYDQMLLFLTMLKEKWVIFKDVHGIFNAKNKQEGEQAVINKLENYLKGVN